MAIERSSFHSGEGQQPGRFEAVNDRPTELQAAFGEGSVSTREPIPSMRPESPLSDLNSLPAAERGRQTRLWTTLARQQQYGIPSRSPEQNARLGEVLDRRDELLGMTDLARRIHELPHRGTERVTLDGWADVESRKENPDWTPGLEAQRRPLADEYWNRYYDLAVKSMDDEQPSWKVDPSLRDTVGEADAMVTDATGWVLDAESHGGSPSYGHQVQRRLRSGEDPDAVRAAFDQRTKQEYPLFGSDFRPHYRSRERVEHQLGKDFQIPPPQTSTV